MTEFQMLIKNQYHLLGHNSKSLKYDPGAKQIKNGTIMDAKFEKIT